MRTPLTKQEKDYLLELARKAMVEAVNGKKIQPIASESIPPRLKELGASFVTITKFGELRGCIGTLEPYLPLVEDVCEHSAAAALHDYRFPPVSPNELNDIHIEISCLTIPEPLIYEEPEELLTKIRPGIDGVVIKDGFHRATFLPQVWQKISSPAEFLDHLCMKMGASPDYWRRKKLKCEIYQVEEFEEGKST
jgi:hypothetical protein